MSRARELADLSNVINKGANLQPNLITNGDMSVDQRNSGSSVTATHGSDTFCPDRYRFIENHSGSFSLQQVEDAPDNLEYSMKVTVTGTDTSLSATEFTRNIQPIEGQHISHLNWGSANARTCTLTFYVKSSVTGAYYISLFNSAANRSFVSSYTINTADTWEKKTITYDGDTVGTINNDNGIGLQCSFWLGAGSNFTSGTLQTSWGTRVLANDAVGQVNLADSTANEWYITGVQLEAGTTASDFEFLPYDVNENRCLRYYQVIADNDVVAGTQIANATSYSSSVAYGVLFYRTTMRAEPSADQSSVSNGFSFVHNGGSDALTTFTVEKVTLHNIRLKNTQTITITQGDAGWYQTSTGGYFALDAEL